MHPAGIHARVRQARISAGLSQAGLADVIGVRPHTVYRYEKQQLTPSTDALLAISRRCGVTIEWLLTGEGEGPAEPLEATGTEG